jgi:hypothetical protein
VPPCPVGSPWVRYSGPVETAVWVCILYSVAYGTLCNALLRHRCLILFDFL